MADALMLAGKNALVTGAGRRGGIGAAVATLFAERGANVVLSDQPVQDDKDGTFEPNGLAEVLRTHGGEVGWLEHDLALPDSPDTLFAEALEILGTIDILVNNAAVSVPSSIDILNADLLDRHYAVNLRATALLCAAFARHYQDGKQRKAGRIINLTSGQGLGPMPGELAYAATKGAIDALTTSLSEALAPRGITVNAVDPGVTDTGWFGDTERRIFSEQTPMGRVGDVQDAARLIAFLASDDAGWMTGQIIRSRGGLRG